MFSRKLLIAVLAALLTAALGPLAALAVGDGGAPVDGSGTPGGDSGGVGLVVGQTTTTVTISGGIPVTIGTTTLNLGGTTTTETIVSGTPTGTTTTPGGGSSTGPVAPPALIPAPAGSAFAKRGMWIWELPATDGGSVPALIAQARRYGIGTLYIKSGDGTGYWSQFNPTLVSDLHAAGLHACAWQYVYGNSPAVEARVGAQAVRDGADCLVIDAESEYNGRYSQASTYIRDLRHVIGARFPVALAGFPYVDYHVGFPYSVFLGTNGAQFNMPQMYWRDIGTTVDAVYAHTFEFNELYQRPILPLGQVFNAPPVAEVKRFRAIGLAYNSTDYSWWDWQAAGTGQFGAVSAPIAPLSGFVAQRTVASVGPRAVGDLVRLIQEHLWNTHERVTIDGSYGASTTTAVARFQTQHGLPATGIVTPQTWSVLLAVKAPRVTYVIRKKKLVASVGS